MKDTHESREPQEIARWRRASELPPDVFAAWRKPERTLNPVAIVATVNPDGTPRTAPFGSLRAVTPQLLRMISMRYHDTYANLRRDGRVTVALLAPPSIAATVRGRARVVRERMNADEHSAVVEIDVEEVKNDMARSIVVETGITISAREKFRDWFEAGLAELDEM